MSYYDCNYYGTCEDTYYTDGAAAENNEDMEEDGWDMGAMGVVGHGLVASANVVACLSAWYIVYAERNQRWNLTFWWDKAWNSHLLITAGVWGPMMLLWGGMAVFNSPLVSAVFALWVLVTALGDLLGLLPVLFLIFSITSDEDAHSRDVMWMIFGTLAWFANVAFTLFFGIPTLDYIAEEIGMEGPSAWFESEEGDEEEDDAEEDDAAANDEEETAEDDWANW